MPMLSENEEINDFYSWEKDEELPLPRGYENDDELLFYNNDLEFMRHHKRTKRNIEENLQLILES